MDTLESLLSPEQRAALASLDTPFKIQAYLDSIPYNGADRNRSPLGVMREQQSHCYDGALMGAAALRRLGHLPLVMDLWPEPGTDDDHVLALYRVDGCWGAVAKSNFAGLRFREPIYRTLRELVLSYFEVFFNSAGVKTLRSYTRPLNLSPYDSAGWETNERAVEAIEHHLNRLHRFPILTSGMAARLSPVDERAYQAGMLGTDPHGLFKVK